MRGRVAIISPQPEANIGGVERFCHDLARILALISVDARVISSGDLEDSRYDAVITNGMVTVRTSLPRMHVYHGCWVRHMRYNHQSASRGWRAATTLVGAAREVQGGLRARRVAVAGHVAADVRRIYRLRCHGVIENAVDTGLYRPIDRGLARRELGLDRTATIALFVGRDEDLKRPDLARHASQAAGYQLHSAGSAAIPGMTWLGRLDQARMANAMAAADVLIAPSDYEACSLAVLEGLAVGTAVVTTRTGWVDDLVANVPGYAALTAAVADGDGLIRAMRAVPSSKAAVTEASEWVRSHNTLEAVAPLWEAQLAHLLGSSGTVGNPI